MKGETKIATAAVLLAGLLALSLAAVPQGVQAIPLSEVGDLWRTLDVPLHGGGYYSYVNADTNEVELGRFSIHGRTVEYIPYGTLTAIQEDKVPCSPDQTCLDEFGQPRFVATASFKGDPGRKDVFTLVGNSDATILVDNDEFTVVERELEVYSSNYGLSCLIGKDCPGVELLGDASFTVITAKPTSDARVRQSFSGTVTFNRGANAGKTYDVSGWTTRNLVEVLGTITQTEATTTNAPSGGAGGGAEPPQSDGGQEGTSGGAEPPAT